jgi:hypothetical protein
MRLFPVPYSITEEEKIFGGYLSLRQVIYLAVSAMAAAAMLFCARIMPLPLRLFFGLMLTGLGTSFAFIKIADTGLDRYLMSAAIFFSRQKRYYFFSREGDAS